jgi:hypothetical protein
VILDSKHVRCYFLCFQDAFVAGEPYADCDENSVFDVFDFLCFQDAFVTGCQ